MTINRDDNEPDDYYIEKVKERASESDSAEFEEAYDSLSQDSEESDDLNDIQQVKSKGKFRGFMIDLSIYAFIIFLCIYIIPNFVIQRTIVDGSSMEDTLHNGENLMVEKISYRMDQLNRFDIIVFYPYGRGVDEYYVKRIIGLPGEKVQIVGSDILINDEVLEENYGKDPITFAGIAENPIELGDDEFFVMGDNREISKDSRYSEVGKVQKENIGGRAIFRIWPLNKFGTIE